MLMDRCIHKYQLYVLCQGLSEYKKTMPTAIILFLVLYPHSRYFKQKDLTICNAHAVYRPAPIGKDPGLRGQKK